MKSTRLALFFASVLLVPTAFAQSGPSVPSANGRIQTDGTWKTGKIVRAEQPKRKKPEPYEVWNPALTHWYTLETPSETIKATETVPAGAKWGPGTTSGGVDRDPPMAFSVGQTVKFSLHDQPPDSSRKRELYVLDRKGKKHILTVDSVAQTDPERSQPRLESPK